MKKLTRRGFTAAAILGILGVGLDGLESCAARFIPSNNEIQTVYGPPPQESSSFEPTENVNVDVYGPPVDSGPEFDPELNHNICVYGPPEWFE
jgi:hypothetical protein